MTFKRDLGAWMAALLMSIGVMAAVPTGPAAATSKAVYATRAIPRASRAMNLRLALEAARQENQASRSMAAMVRAMSRHSLGDAIRRGSATSPASTAVRCHGVPATIVGTPGNDNLIGTAGPDVIAALGGNDYVSGSDGNDIICGGEGTDILEGGAGDDAIYGGPSSSPGDILFPEAGNDTVVGGACDGCQEVVWFSFAPGPMNVDLAAGTASGEGTDTLQGVEGVVGSA